MRQALRFLILAGAAIIPAGCKTDQPAPNTEKIDARPTLPSDNSAAPAHPSPAPQPDHRPLIVCFGDSLTAGYGTDPGQSYPDYLQTDLDAKGYNYRVVNAGVSGATTKDGVNRLPSIVTMKPALVIVEFGGNDGLRGLPIEDSRANLNTIVSGLNSSTKIVIAGITLPPNYGADYIKQFDQTYTMLAKKYNAPLMPFLLKDVYGVPGMMQADETHATAAGNKIVAIDVEQLITPMLKK